VSGMATLVDFLRCSVPFSVSILSMLFWAVCDLLSVGCV